MGSSPVTPEKPEKDKADHEIKLICVTAVCLLIIDGPPLHTRKSSINSGLG